MSVFSKAIESILKNASKKPSTSNTTQNINKNATMPNKNPQGHKMQEQHIQDFGKNYAEFKGKGQEAIKHLLQTKSGQVQGGFYRDDLGEITLCWGKVTNTKKNEGYGLAHILDKRTHEMGEQKALDFIHSIPKHIKNAQLKQDDKGRIKLENEKVVIGIKNNWKGQKTPHWIVTSYEIKDTKGGSGSLYTSPQNDISEILPKTPLDNSTKKQNKKQETNTILENSFNRS